MLVFLVLYFAFVHRGKIVRNLTKTMIVLGVVCSVVLGLMVFQEGSFVREKVLDLQGMQGRLTVWDGAWKGFLEKPLVGWGLESFDIVFLKNFEPKMFLSEYDNEVWFDRAHNIVFDSLVTTGLIGTLLFFGILVVALYALWRKYLREDQIDFLAPILFTSFFVAYFVQGLTVFDMVSSYMILFLSLAFITALCYTKEKENQEKRFNVLSLSLLVPLFFTLNLFVYQPYQGNLSIIQATRSLGDEVASHQKAIESSFMGRDQNVRYLAERIINNHKGEIEAIEKKKESAKSLEEYSQVQKELEEKKRVTELKFAFLEEKFLENVARSSNFRDYWAMARFQSVYFEFKYLDLLVEDYSQEEQDKELFDQAVAMVDKQKEYAQKAIELSPRNLQGYWELAQAEINHGKILLLLRENEQSKEKFEEALMIVEQTIEMEPNLLNSHIKAINIAKTLLGNFDLARQKTQEAIEINPSWKELLDE
jgi:tetratricopeptide (TPR) repeat protein